MNEYEFYNIYTQEEKILYGYSLDNACEKNGLDRETMYKDGWICMGAKYID